MIEIGTPSGHVSFSQLTQYISCAKAYELKRLRGAVETPAWYLAAGKAVHATVEQYMRWIWEREGR